MNSAVAQSSSDIKNLNIQSIKDMKLIFNSPSFLNYFELSDTKDGNKYQNGIMQFSEEQNKIKLDYTNWMYVFQNNFQIDEICVIDRSGQEHSRIVLSEIAPDIDLSSEERSTPFFDASFQKEKDQVHIEEPYISPDTDRLVFAYTTPIVSENGDKLAFLHFEMPMFLFENIVKQASGEIFVIDLNGKIIVDTEHDDFSKLKSHDISKIIDSGEFQKIVTHKNEVQEEELHFKHNFNSIRYDDGENIHYVVMSELPLFDWILVYDKTESMILSEDSSLISLKNTVMGIFAITAVFLFVGIYLISKKISKPMRLIIKSCNEIDPDDLNIIKLKNIGEFEGIKNSINLMIEKIFHNEERIHLYQEETKALSKEVEFQNIELSKQLTKNAEVERKKEEFLSMMTHEFKTPLTPIISWVDILSSGAFGELNEKQSGGILKIKNNAMKLLGLITDVLDAHKLDLDEMTFNRAMTSSKQIVSEFIENYNVVLQKNSIKFITINIDDVELNTDKNRLEQVLRIFITNAIDFVPEINPQIELCVKQDDDNLVFSIKDNGVGILKENHEKLFNKFYQIDSTVTRKHGGSGLGLSVAKGIAIGLDGNVGIKSEIGKGSEFFIKVPINTKILEAKIE